MYGTNKHMKEIFLQPVKDKDIDFLYNLLKRRSSRVKISHKKMPILSQHKKFVKSKPYSRWYIILKNKKKIGSIYLTQLNEIGMSLRKEFDYKEIKESVLEKLIAQSPKDRYLINISPKNKRAMNFYKKKGFKLIQYTFEYVSGEED